MAFNRMPQETMAQVFFKQAMALKNTGNLTECYGCLVEGIVNYCATEEDRLNYFSMLASILPFLRIGDHSVLDAFTPTSQQFWANVLQYLSFNQDWSTVSFLILGLNREVVWPLEGIASEVPTYGIRISDLLSHLSDMDLKNWGILLAICLLRKGAAVEGIAVDETEPVAVALVKSAIRAGNRDLFKYVMETSSKVRSQINSKDKNGDTPLHILVKSGKTNSYSGEDLLKLLLNYGASVNVKDSFARLPIEYMDIRTPSYHYLDVAANEEENTIKEKVRNIKEEGNRLQQYKDYERALRRYNDAIELGMTIANFNQDLAKLHSNCSIVYFNLGQYQASLNEAETSVKYDPTFYKGYWKMGQCHTALGDQKAALDVYVLALTTTTMSDDVTVSFLVAITHLLPQLRKKRISFTDAIQNLIDTFNTFLPNVFSSLFTSSLHEDIRLLLLGPDPTLSKYNGGIRHLKQTFPTMNSGLTSQFRTYDVELGPFLRFPELEWMDELIIVLMLNGAKCDSLTLSQGDTPLHAVVGFCAEAGSSMLLEFLLQTYPQFSDNKFIQDDEGQSVYHTVCRYFPSGESDKAVKLTEILLRYGFDPSVQDRQQRCPSDLVPASSTLYGLFVGRTSVASDADPMVFKEEGNREFQHQNYDRAIAMYTKGIEAMKHQSKGFFVMIKSMFVSEENRDLAVLYGNRAECYLKKNMQEKALEDSKESFTQDRTWFKANVRLGRCLQALKRDGAVDAFVSAYNAAPSDEQIQKEILKELLVTISQSLKPGEIINNLNPVSVEMWAILAYDLIKKGSQWNVAQYAYEFFSKMPTVCSKITLNLRPLCDPDNLAQHSWCTELILFFLKNGSDHNTLTFQYGDTYLHAGVLIVFITGNLDILIWLLDNTLTSVSDMSIGDINGDTILHLVTSVRTQSNVKLQLLRFLLDRGINSLQQNRQGLSALDLLPPSEMEARHILRVVMNAASMKETHRRTKHESRTDPCHACDQIYHSGIREAEQRNFRRAVRSFLQVMLLDHRSERHKDLNNKCLEQTVTALCRMPLLDFPDTLRNLSPNTMNKLIQRISEEGQWPHVLAAINLYEARRLPKYFAKIMSVTSLITSKTLSGSESKRLQILTLLQKHGASLPVQFQTDTLRTVVGNCEIRVLHRLLDEGISPAKLTLKDGDTPLHVALSVALEVNKGDFSLIERFLDLYRSDPTKYKYLDPKCVNKEGDTLLHVACKSNYNKHSQKAVEFLCNQKIPANVLNKDGKIPIQYLRQRNDRRAQFLRVLGGKLPATKPESKDTQQETWTKEGLQPNQQTASQKAPIQDSNQGIRVEAVNKSGVTLIKERIRELLLERPDPPVPVWEDYEGGAVSTEENSQGHMAEARTDMTLQHKPEFVSSETDISDGMTKVLDDSDTEREDIYADILSFDNLTWEVECTANVWKCLRDKHIPPELKKRTIHRIRLLASGEWRPYLHKRINNVPPTLELYEAKLSKAARIIWEVAITFSARCSDEAEKRLDKNEGHEFAVKGGRIYSEVIRVWDIVFHHDNLPKAIQNIAKSHKKGETCILKKALKGIKDSQFEGKVKKRYPLLFAEQDDDINQEVLKQKQMMLCPPASAKETEYHILKFYSFSTTLVHTILQNFGSKVDLPFRVTDKEHAVIHLKCKSPILLMGRSGTGKTTCCLYRLWTSFISYWVMARETGHPLLPRAERIFEDDRCSGLGECNEDVHKQKDPHTSSDSEHQDSEISSQCQEEEAEEDNDYSGTEYDHLHQIFVTKNRVLCSEVHKNFYELCHAHEETKDHTDKEAEDLPPKLQDIEDLSYPLFLTSKQLLLMLDASLGPPHFFDRNEDGSLSVRVQGWGAQDELFGFTTLETDSDDEDAAYDNIYEEVDEDHSAQPNRQQQKKDPRREVTYEVFAEEVWPKIVKKLSVRYHPSLVWTEIMSFIKGSFEALFKSEGYLTSDEYVEVGKKRAPNFSGDREKVYELFKQYDHFKRQNFLFDEADLVQNIYKRLRSMTQQPWVFHQLYVDETQDFTQAELCVLLRISQNPNDMFLTGDTAQGIMRGISFRFSDLRSLFFYAKKSLHARGQIGTVNVPKQIYQLTHNYRSHAGILSLASAVLDLMVEFFPESFDRLQKDQGLFYGPPPILLESCSVENLAILLKGNQRRTSRIEFGAHQAILVVNDTVKNNMPEELSQGIVLTIYEAKGLEFDDVLLYNFFKDSQARKEWRVVTTFLEKFAHASDKENPTENLVTIDEDILLRTKRTRPLTFDPNLHKVLNSEMKHLYTAITRARVNVWIFDEDEEKHAPMFEYFKSRNLVRCISQEDIHTDAIKAETVFAEKSTPEDWVTRGDEMMGRYLYQVAAKCYRMGDDDKKEKSALAHNQALKAKNITNNPKKMREEFIMAAEKLLETDHDNKAALCLQNAKEYDLAALAYEKTGMLGDASKMYRRCKKHIDGSRCYEQMGNYHKAVEVLDSEELYDQAIDCLERYKLVVSQLEQSGQDIPKVLQHNKPREYFSAERLSYKAATFYHKYKNEDKMLEALDRLPRIQDRVDFLKERSYIEHAARVLTQDGKTADAALMMLEHGVIDKALEFAEKGEDSNSIGDTNFAKARSLMSSEHQRRVTEHLMKARDAYIAAENMDGVGNIWLSLARIKHDKGMVIKAMSCFSDVKPYSNEMGKLEALDLLVQFSSMNDDFEDVLAVIRGVNTLFQVVLTLLKPSNQEEQSRSQLYLNFYGLQEKDANTVVVYPKLMPEVLRVLQDFFTSEQKTEQTVVEIQRKDICMKLSFHLADMLHIWTSAIRDALRNHVSHKLQCKVYLKGDVCPDDDYCPYLHKTYNRTSAFKALDALLWEVHLDSALQTGAQNISRIRIQGLVTESKKLANKFSSFLDDTNQFDSCERLLDFLVPEHHHMRNLTENTAATSKLIRHLSREKVPAQVERFLNHLWEFRLDNLKNQHLMEERSKSTDWFARASILCSLFKLKLGTKKICQELESEVMKHKPEWLSNLNMYALLADCHGRTFKCIGGRFLEVHLLLQQDPCNAIFEYAKVVRELSSKGRMSVFPSMPFFFLFQELFVCVVCSCIAKLTYNAKSFVLPATYLATIHFVNGTFSMGTIQEAIQGNVNRQDLRKIRVAFLQIVEILCGHKLNLLRITFTQDEDGSEINYLLAERCLVLALVVLVNTGAFVPEKLETSLMSTIMNLKLSDEAPCRLRNGLQAVKQARGLRDIAAILRDLLDQREGEYLYSCSWQWDNQHKEGVHFHKVVISDEVSHKFLIYNPANPIPDSMNLLVLDEHVELTSEDARMTRIEQQQLEEDSKRERCAFTLYRFLKWCIFKKRLESGSFLTFCKKQEMKDIFAPCDISETFCGICGISFQVKELVMKDLAEDKDINVRVVPSAEQKSDTLIDGEYESASLQSHKTTSEHVQKKLEFEPLKKLYRDYFILEVPEMRKFITRMKLREKDFTSEHYPNHALDVSQLTSEMDKILNTFKTILRECKWNQTEMLRSMLDSLYEIYTKVKPEIETQHKTYLQSLAAQCEVSDKKGVTDAGDENEDSDREILEVVREPVRRKKQPKRKVTRGGRGRQRQRRDTQDDDGNHRRDIAGGLIRTESGREAHYRDFKVDPAPRLQKQKVQQRSHEQF